MKTTFRQVDLDYKLLVKHLENLSDWFKYGSNDLKWLF